jgi:tRNA (adenine58-N1)-methyltransferase non-catalytic subunit
MASTDDPVIPSNLLHSDNIHSSINNTNNKTNRMIMKEDDVVLLHMNNSRWQFINLRRNKTIAIGKHKSVNLDPLLNECSYGSLFEVDEKGVLELVGCDIVDEQSEQIQAPVEDERSNKSYDDLNGAAQKLSDKEIESMRKSGLSGEAIIDELVANSATFNQKTAFAQEKYKMKKMKKHLTKIIARWPSPRYVCEAYFYKQPQITNSLRFDILGLMMNLGNVMANSQPLIVEDCGGVVIGAAANRMGGKGIACAGYVGEHPSSMETIKQMNLTEKEKSVIMTISLRALSSQAAKKKREVDEEAAAAMEGVTTTTAEESCEEEEVKVTIESPAAAAAAAAAARKNNNNNNNNNNKNGGSKETNNVRKIAKATNDDIERFITTEKFTSLILANPQLDPRTILPQLLEFCAKSTPFIVWSMTVQPLAETMHLLRKNSLAVSMTISEPFLRDHQVLPGRSHPVMTTEANSGGYILFGTYTKQEDIIVDDVDKGNKKSSKKPRLDTY